jgi:Zn-finger nucleic acid-binding protein
MKCPTCTDQTLVMADRSGIEIDYCPACRGVWLDRGELDKIIERSAPTAAPTAAPAPPVAPVAVAPDLGPAVATPQQMPSPAGHAPLPQPRPQRWDDDFDDDDDDDRRRYDPRYGGKPYKKKRAKSIFEEIFDF